MKQLKKSFIAQKVGNRKSHFLLNYTEIIYIDIVSENMVARKIKILRCSECSCNQEHSKGRN